MALSDKWWIWCFVSLLCAARLGSCRRHRQDGAPHEPYIFSEVCALKDESGPCRAIKDRFFFNINTRKCEMFEYGGCGGNKNNFETLEECEEACVVSDDKNPCHLPEAPGPCRGLVTRYLFDSQIQRCRNFFYGGCFGNANNFKSMAECHAKCQNPVAKPSKAPEVRTSDVLPNIAAGELTVLEAQVQLHSANQEIRELKPRRMCFRPVERGMCDEEEKRFAYNPETKRCQAFNYSGCGGNENNFKSRRDCYRSCRRKLGREMIAIKRKNLFKIPRSEHMTLSKIQ